jgi:AbrB family looped-hinge helix DNA binding protein
VYNGNKNGGERMKATGMVRKIDNLGRIVIPKEILRTLGIKNRDSLEIYVGDVGQIILKKYNPTPQALEQIAILDGLIIDDANYSSEVSERVTNLLKEFKQLLQNENT